MFRKVACRNCSRSIVSFKGIGLWVTGHWITQRKRECSILSV
jgi:hypothetical protein